MASSLICKVTILPHDAYAHYSSFVYNVIANLSPTLNLTFFCLTHQNLNALGIECILFLLIFSVVTFR